MINEVLQWAAIVAAFVYASVLHVRVCNWAMYFKAQVIKTFQSFKKGSFDA